MTARKAVSVICWNHFITVWYNAQEEPSINFLSNFSENISMSLLFWQPYFGKGKHAEILISPD